MTLHRRTCPLPALVTSTALLGALLQGCGGDQEPAPDVQAPSAPTGTQAAVLSPTRVALSWASATDDVGVTRYQVLRGGTVMAGVGTSLQYTASGLTPSTSYTFAVQACDAADNCSAPSLPVLVTTPPLAPGLSVGSNQLLIGTAAVLGRNDPARAGVAYAGASIDFGPYTVVGAPTPVVLTVTGPLAGHTRLVVEGAPGLAAASVVNGHNLVISVDFAAFASAYLAATGQALPYATQYLPSFTTANGNFVGFGGPGTGGLPAGGIITCSNPLLPAVSFTTPCR